MIRRDTYADQETPAWVLIDQVEHARVSGDLARSWGAAGFAPLDPREIVLTTVYRHDDGWRGYDRSPDIDPERGWPVAFTEMEINAAHAIWSRSIQEVADLGPLAQFLVASHFIARCRVSSRANRPEAVQFVQQHQSSCQQWLQQWLAADRSNTTQQALIAVEHLRLFDALSVWLCRKSHTEPTTLPAPAGSALTLRPIDPFRIQVDPWPFATGQLVVEAHGRRLPAQFYPDASALAAAANQPEILSWQLTPGG